MSWRAGARRASNDPLVSFLFFATVVHGILILGLGFSFPKPEPANNDIPTLDITVVSQATGKTPEHADFLANASNDGKKQNRRQPLVDDQPPRPVRKPTPDKSQSPSLVARQPDKPVLSAKMLAARSLEMVKDEPDLTTTHATAGKRLRQKFIDARTKEHKYASYLAGWVAKVERVGNLNYPDEARRRQLSGTLLLQVALNADGSVRKVSLLRSSGHRVLDDAAIRIVRMSAPFAPLPADIRKETDILNITRTWEFLSSNQLYSR